MTNKTLLIFGLALLSSQALHAQFYVRAGGGYALPMARDIVGTEYRQGYDGNAYYSTVEEVNASYGNGATFQVGGGYMFSKYIGVDMSINYLLGKTFTTGYYYTDAGGVEEDYDEVSTKSFFIAPSLVLSGGEGTKVPYGRFGIIIGAPKVEGEGTYYYNLDGVTTGSSKWEQRGGTSIGFQGAIGMNWVLNDNLKLYTELNLVSMTYYPEEKVLTESSYNGVSNIDQISEYYKRTEYKKKIDTNSEPPLDQPRQELRDGLPFSSVSFQVGIVYLLGGISID